MEFTEKTETKSDPGFVEKERNLKLLLDDDSECHSLVIESAYGLVHPKLVVSAVMVK